MREAPSIPLITGLLDLGAKVRAHDPVGMEQAVANCRISNIATIPMPVSAARTLVIITEWAQFRALDLKRVKREMAKPFVVDLRNIYRPEDMAAHGFIYESIGRRRMSKLKIVEGEVARPRQSSTRSK